MAGLTPTNNAAVNRGDYTDKENFMRSHTNYSNHRSTTVQPDTYRSGFSSAIGAVIAPFVDALRPTRKEELNLCGHVYVGGAQTPVPKDYVNNPNDVLKTTIKEQTMYAPTFNINNQRESMYVNNAMPGHLTQRDTTSCQQIGPAGGYATGFGDMLYGNYYNETQNEIKSSTIYNRPNDGGLNLFNGNINQCTSRQDSNCYDNWTGPANSIIKMPIAPEYYGKQSTKHLDPTVGASAPRNEPFVVEAFLRNPYTQNLTTSV
jgi:hypothetical protein